MAGRLLGQPGVSCFVRRPARILPTAITQTLVSMQSEGCSSSKATARSVHYAEPIVEPSV